MLPILRLSTPKASGIPVENCRVLGPAAGKYIELYSDSRWDVPHRLMPMSSFSHARWERIACLSKAVSLRIQRLPSFRLSDRMEFELKWTEGTSFEDFAILCSETVTIQWSSTRYNYIRRKRSLCRWELVCDINRSSDRHASHISSEEMEVIIIYEDNVTMQMDKK